MATSAKTGKRPILGYSMALVCGLLLFGGVKYGLLYGQLAAMKLQGNAEHCPWPAVFGLPIEIEETHARNDELLLKLAITEQDDTYGIDKVQTPDRYYWARRGGLVMNSRQLIGMLVAEHERIARVQPRYVRPGDVVLDVGGHVGVFAHHALKHGAAKVIMVEPDPVNLECIRRNFPQELKTGRIVLIPEGAWETESTLELAEGVGNSGENSLIKKENGARTVKVRVRPIDSMLAELGVTKIDFVKMDIEGAERHALRGAAHLLKNSKPRLLIDSYHMPDDATVLPQVIGSLNPSYQSQCTSCEFDREVKSPRLIPHIVVYW